MNQRILVHDTEIAAALKMFTDRLTTRIAQKGRGSFISELEIQGSVDQEVIEFKQAVHRKNRKDTVEELMDVAVGCVFGTASLIAITRQEQAEEAARAQAALQGLPKGGAPSAGPAVAPRSSNLPPGTAQP